MFDVQPYDTSNIWYVSNDEQIRAVSDVRWYIARSMFAQSARGTVSVVVLPGGGEAVGEFVSPQL